MTISAVVRKFPRAGWDAIAKATTKIIAETRKDSTIETLACQIVYAHQQFEQFIRVRFPAGSRVAASVGLGDVDDRRRQLMHATVSQHQRPASQMIEFGLVVELDDAECTELQSWRDCGRNPANGMRLIRWGWYEIERAARDAATVPQSPGN